MSEPKNWMLVACVLAGSAVGLGAFGAHALKSRIDAYALSVFEVGVRYHFYHALALGLLAISARTFGHSIAAPAIAFVVGIAIFSTSLYALAVTGIRALGAITPIGGLSLIVGWALWVRAVWKS